MVPQKNIVVGTGRVFVWGWGLFDADDGESIMNYELLIMNCECAGIADC